MRLYRDHTGSLSESMKTVREVKNLTEITFYVYKKWRIKRTYLSQSTKIENRTEIKY